MDAEGADCAILERGIEVGRRGRQRIERPGIVLDRDGQDIAAMGGGDVDRAIGTVIPPGEIDLFCGIATGEVVAGSVGPARSQNFTVIGNAVNLAARLEAASKSLGTPILISEAIGRHADREFELREMAPLDLRGRSKPERVFELIGGRAAA